MTLVFRAQRVETHDKCQHYVVCIIKQTAYYVENNAGDVICCHGDDVVDGQLAHLQQCVADDVTS